MAPALALAEPIEGPRVRVRAWRRKDRSAIGHWPRPDLPSVWLDAGDVAPGPRVSFAIEARGAGQLIGRLTLRDITSSARIGIYLHPAWCNQGYGSEAIALLASAARAWGLEDLRLDVAEENRRAVRAYQKAGFRIVGAFQRAGLLFWDMTNAPARAVCEFAGTGSDDRLGVRHNQLSSRT